MGSNLRHLAPRKENVLVTISKNRVVRKVGAFVVGAALLFACGFLPVAMQGPCKAIVVGVNTILTATPPLGEDPLAVLKDEAGAPPRCEPGVCLQVAGHYDFNFDGGRCRCAQ